jgi:hypothetical protein
VVLAVKPSFEAPQKGHFHSAIMHRVFGGDEFRFGVPRLQREEGQGAPVKTRAEMGVNHIEGFVRHEAAQFKKTRRRINIGTVVVRYRHLNALGRKLTGIDVVPAVNHV